MERARRAFTSFAEECRGSSPLYESLSLRIAEDLDILRIAESARPDQPIGNLLFAAVHALLLDGGGPALGAYYRSLAPEPRPPGEAFPAFRAFVLDRAAEIQTLLAERLVQTNEVRRSIYIAAAFARLRREFPGRRWSLIELGASAGLNLIWDRFAYRFDGDEPFGDPASPIRIGSETRGPHRPPSDLEELQIVDRVGVDLNPIDLRSERDRLWLRALIWPEHAERRELMERAVEVQARDPVRIVAGDGVRLLPGLAGTVSAVTVLAIYHTHVANQLGAEGRAALLEAVERIGRERDLVHLHNNVEPHLHATFYRSGERHDLPLARTEGHARWVEWLDPAP